VVSAGAVIIAVIVADVQRSVELPI